MKKLILLAFAAMLCVACSTEENTDTTEGTNLDVVLENYKGVFTTQDGQTRGALSVELSEDNLYATGSLALSTGEVIAMSTDQITEVGNRKEITFTSSDLTFTMTTGEEEEIMAIDAVTFRGAESSILVGQNTVRAPLEPIVGSYTCPGCAAPLNNLGSETFNLIIGPANGVGNSQVATQTTLGTTTYNGNATQSGCAVINGEQTTCDLRSGTVFGVTGTAFNPGAGPVTWSGTHTFDNDTNPAASDCSTVSGTWSWASNTIGTVGGVFTSNPTGDCVAPPPPVTTLVFEDFETAIVSAPSSGYVVGDAVIGNTNITEFNLNRFEAGIPIAADYFGRAQPSELNNSNPAISIGNIQGNRFFGVQDADASQGPLPSGADNLTLTWSNINVSSLSSMNASAFFAENQGTGEEWDADHSVRFEYSTDNTNWTKFFAIEAEEPGGDTTNNAPRVDTNLDGLGEGAEITNTLTEYTSADVNVSGINTISVRIIMTNFSSGRENAVFDNVTISGS